MSQSATDTTRELGVVLARRSLDNPWIDHVWVAQTVLYPGHNYDSAPHASMAVVKAQNPYLQASSLAAWRQLRGG